MNGQDVFSAFDRRVDFPRVPLHRADEGELRRRRCRRANAGPPGESSNSSVAQILTVDEGLEALKL